jgi:hypothetical protein
MYLPRSAGFSFDHRPAYAARAARTARSTSAPSARATRASTSSRAGLIVSKYFPARGGTNLPPTYRSYCGSMRTCSVLSGAGAYCHCVAKSSFFSWRGMTQSLE